MPKHLHHIKSVSQFNQLKGVETQHPLISLIDQSKAKAFPSGKYVSDLYFIFLKDSWCAEIVYGRKHYDYQDGTLVFIGAGQEFGFEYTELPKVPPNGWGIAFHKDLLLGTTLQKTLEAYHFFDYRVSEALHISVKERAVLLQIFLHLNQEINNPVDQHSRILIVSQLELLLNYSKRFYERQFNTRVSNFHVLPEKINALLDDYYQQRLYLTQGTPSVAYCADKFNLSPNYFGDLVKQHLGVSAQHFIQDYILTRAKNYMQTTKLSVKEIATVLGFEYPNHFSRFFKEKTGSNPTAYKSILN